MLGIFSFKDLIKYPIVKGAMHRWYIILLGNMRNQTPAMRLVFNNYYYLNRRTENIRYYLPGIDDNDVGVDSSLIKDGIDAYSEFFRPAGFLDTVNWLEFNNHDYEYSEGMDMILLPYSCGNLYVRDGEFDFGNMLWYRLDDLMKQGVNLITFMKKAMDVVGEDMSYEETKKHLNIVASPNLDETPKIKVSIIKMPEQWKLPENERTKEPWAIKINVNGESFNIKVGSKDQRMVYVCTLIRQKLGEHMYLHEFFNNSRGRFCKFTKEGSESWLREVYNLLFMYPARDFSEWIAKANDAKNLGRSINQGKSQINAYIKRRLKDFGLDVSEMPIIDKMEDENKDSYYTTYLNPEDIDIPEEFLSIPLSVKS